MALEAQFIQCVNNAGFVMYFTLWAGAIGVGSGEYGSWKSDDYPIGQSRTVDLSSTRLFEGISVSPKVGAEGGGATKIGNKLVVYRKNGMTASWDVRGTAYSYTVALSNVY